ncbi:MAG: hypothetical protein DMF89_13705 [Acidobacteria bacterium]|nr:MAG: hypothetical protein DMF89_13705 [Acidobacteriota bacterium]
MKIATPSVVTGPACGGGDAVRHVASTQRRTAAAGRLGYVVTSFPRVSETFIINEIIELERQGFDLRIYSMAGPTDRIRHRLVDEIRAPIRYLPKPLSPSIGRVLADHARLLVRLPRAYVSTLLRIVASGERDLIARFPQASCLVRLLEREQLTRERLRVNARKRVEETFNVRRNALAIGRELRAVMEPPPKETPRTHARGGSPCRRQTTCRREPR